jgi:predicted nucleic acid-binding protein
VDGAVAHAYGRVYATVAAAGRKARGRRAFRSLDWATALAAELPLYTRNPKDFPALSNVLEIVVI